MKKYATLILINIALLSIGQNGTTNSTPVWETGMKTDPESIQRYKEIRAERRAIMARNTATNSLETIDAPVWETGMRLDPETIQRMKEVRTDSRAVKVRNTSTNILEIAAESQASTTNNLVNSKK